jgi:hypothetical protein
MTCNLAGAKFSEEISTRIILFRKMQQVSLKRQYVSSKLYSIQFQTTVNFTSLSWKTKPFMIFKNVDYSESHKKHYDSRCVKQTFLIFILLIEFCTMTNKCTIISQIIILLHVSALSCHPQEACNQYLAKLPKYFKCSCW